MIFTARRFGWPRPASHREIVDGAHPSSWPNSAWVMPSACRMARIISSGRWYTPDDAATPMPKMPTVRARHRGAAPPARSEICPPGVQRCTRWSARDSGRPATGSEHVRLDRTGPRRLGDDLLERRDAVIPLDERRDGPEAPYRLAVERPHGRRHRVVVGVDEMRAGVAVTGEVDLSDTIPRQAREVFG